jgi:protein SCO1/2
MGAAFLAGLVLCFGVVLLVTGRVSTPVAQQIAAIGGPFKLTDQTGQQLTDQDLKGRPFLVFFGFTHCPDVCPTTLFEVSEILRTLGPVPIGCGRCSSLSIPERDTPAVMGLSLSTIPIAGLNGDPAAIAAVAAYRVYFKKVPLDQGAPPRTTAISPDGQEGCFGRPSASAVDRSRCRRSAPVPVSRCPRIE